MNKTETAISMLKNSHEMIEGALSLQKSAMNELNQEFTEPGEDITDHLPTLDEAIKLREENKKLKEENEKLNSYGQEQHDHYENEILNLKEELKKRTKLSKDEFWELLKMNQEKDTRISELEVKVDELKEELEVECATNVDQKCEDLQKEIVELKKQIPKKPRKCFSYNDKQVLKGLVDRCDITMPDPSLTELSGEEYRLLTRLLK